MARFKVISSRLMSASNGIRRTELTIVPFEGKLKVGDTFWAFETYHPFEVTVRAVRDADERQIAECEARDILGTYEGFFDDAVVDTSGRKRGEHFFWDHG